MPKVVVAWSHGVSGHSVYSCQEKLCNLGLDAVISKAIRARETLP